MVIWLSSVLAGGVVGACIGLSLGRVIIRRLERRAVGDFAETLREGERLRAARYREHYAHLFRED